MPLLAQPEALQDSLVELPPFARLPRLDLAIDWESPWQGFTTSLRANVTGPRAPTYEELADNPGFRADWVRQRWPRGSFLAACALQAAAIWILILPIWGFLPKVTPTLAPVQIELTWYGNPEYLKPIKLRAAAPKPAEKKTENANQAAARGADAYHPKQTIISIPVRVTHPRQTLIQPAAPPAPPKIVAPLPNMVQWAAAEPQRPHLKLAPTNSAPQIKQRVIKDVAAPDVIEKNAGPINVATSPATIAKPHMVLTPMTASVAQRHEVHAQPVAAPEIAANSETGDNSLHRIVALSAAPAPPASAKAPEGNLAARISISPEGTKPGAPGGAGHAGTSADAGGANPAGAANPANGAGSSSLPASVSVTDEPPHISNGGIAGGRSRPGALNLNPIAPTVPPSVTTRGPANVKAFDASQPPEKILSGKEVYTLHINLPNLTSASGSWVLNFAELNEEVGPPNKQRAPIAAPVPLSNADPKYPPELIKEHVRGEVVLYAIIRKDGTVDSVQIVKSLDPQLDKNAAEALSLWKFRPATREGVPLDLEAVVHIPFTYINPRE